jgi:hypothetical protein
MPRATLVLLVLTGAAEIFSPHAQHVVLDTTPGVQAVTPPSRRRPSTPANPRSAPRSAAATGYAREPFPRDSSRVSGHDTNLGQGPGSGYDQMSSLLTLVSKPAGRTANALLRARFHRSKVGRGAYMLSHTAGPAFHPACGNRTGYRCVCTALANRLVHTRAARRPVRILTSPSRTHILT